MVNLWFGDFPPRIHRRRIPQTCCQPQLVTFQLPNITRISSGLSVVPAHWQHLVHPTLEEKLHNNRLIIHWYSPFSMLALNQLHPLLFSCSHANIYVTNQSFVMEMDKAVFQYSRFPTGISQNTSMYCSTYCFKYKIKLTLVLRCFKLNQVIWQMTAKFWLALVD